MSGFGEAGDASRYGVTSLDDVVDELRRALADIRHGSVTLIVQDGRVVQIDTTQKLRLVGGRRPGPARQSPNGDSKKLNDRLTRQLEAGAETRAGLQLSRRERTA